MEIVFEKGEEEISSWKLTKFKPAPRYPAMKLIRQSLITQLVPTGTLLLELLATDFDNFDSFYSFVDRWGYAGLVEHSETVRKMKNEYKGYDDEEDYKKAIEDVWKESSGELKKIQQIFKPQFYFVFNINGPEWASGLTTKERYFIIAHKAYGFLRPTPEKYSNKLNVTFGLYSDSNELRRFMDGLGGRFAEEAEEAEEAEIAKIVKGKGIKVLNFYSSKDIGALCYAEFIKMLENNIRIRLCKNCKNYFIITGRIDTQYCDRTDELGRTCKTIGPMRKHREKPDKDLYTLAYRKAYKTMWARSTLNKNSKNYISDDARQIWRKKAQEKLEEAKTGTLTLDEFKEWLKKSKEGLK